MFFVIFGQLNNLQIKEGVGGGGVLAFYFLTALRQGRREI